MGSHPAQTEGAGMVKDSRPTEDERLATLETAERDEAGMTAAQMEAAVLTVRGLKLDGWVPMMDYISKETGLTRDQVILMWIKWELQIANGIKHSHAERALAASEALQARLEPIYKMIEDQIDEGDPPWK